MALDLNGFDLVGSGVEHRPELAHSGGPVDDWLRRRERVRSGAQQPVVDDKALVPFLILYLL